MNGYATKDAAERAALKRAKDSGADQYVIRESGKYWICREDDLEGFYSMAQTLSMATAGGRLYQ